jgi:hypothetical protein
MNRRTQAQIALLAALVFLFVGLALLAVLVAGLVAGVAGSGALLLGALTVGVFALAARLIVLSRTMKREPAPAIAAPKPPPVARAPKPRPRPATRPGSRTR